MYLLTFNIYTTYEFAVAGWCVQMCCIFIYHPKRKQPQLNVSDVPDHPPQYRYVQYYCKDHGTHIPANPTASSRHLYRTGVAKHLTSI
jgi:hypothetical protein